MAATKTLSVRLEPELVEKLNKMSGAMQRPRAWLMAQAIRRFVEREEWFVDAVNEGIADADAGRLVDHEQVVAWVDSWGADQEQDPPECD